MDYKPLFPNVNIKETTINITLLIPSSPTAKNRFGIALFVDFFIEAVALQFFSFEQWNIRLFLNLIGWLFLTLARIFGSWNFSTSKN